MPRKSVGNRKYKKGKRVTRSKHGRSPVELSKKKLFDLYCDMRDTCKKGGTKKDQSQHFKTDLEEFIDIKKKNFFKDSSIEEGNMTQPQINRLDQYLTKEIEEKYFDILISKTNESKLLKERIRKI